MDEEFGDETKDIVEDNQWDTLNVARHNDGYREGVTDGKEVALQSGFNKGFEKGFSFVQQAAKLRGVLWAIIRTFKKSQTDVAESEQTQAMEKLKGIIQALITFEQEVVKEIQSIELIHNKHGFDETSKSSLTIDEATRLAHEKVDTIKLKRQNDLKELKKSSLDVLILLKLDNFLINMLKE